MKEVMVASKGLRRSGSSLASYQLGRAEPYTFHTLDVKHLSILSLHLFKVQPKYWLTLKQEGT